MAMWYMICAAIVLLLQTGHAQECNDKPPGNQFLFDAIFHGIYEGPLQVVGTRSSILASLGNCGTSVIADMISFFESYGVSLQNVRRYPYQEHDEDDFNIAPYDELTQAGHSRIYSASFLDHTKFMDIHYLWAEWLLIAKKNFNGKNGTLPKGSSLMYGEGRIRVNKQEYCIRHHSKVPQPGSLYWNNVVPIYNYAYNKILGDGSLQGLAVVTNTTASYRYAIAFPGEEP